MRPLIGIMLGGLVAGSAAASDSLLGVINPADAANERPRPQIYASGYYFEGSDYIPMRRFSGDWANGYDPRRGKNLAVQFARTEVGAQFGRWRVGALYRREILLEANRDAVDMVYYNKTRTSVPQGRSAAVDLRMNGFEASGIRVHRGLVLSTAPNWTATGGIGLSLLLGRRTRISQASGQALSTTTGYQYTATIGDSYSRATYPFISDASPTGQGFALDAGARVTWNNGTRLELAFNDLAGSIHWKNMPHTVVNATSDTLVRDSSGYISFNPAVSGMNDINRRAIDQALKPKFRVEYSFPFQRYELAAGVDWVSGYLLPQVAAAYRFAPGWKATLSYDTRFRTLGMKLEQALFFVGVRSESASLDRARAYGLNFGTHLSF